MYKLNRILYIKHTGYIYYMIRCWPDSEVVVKYQILANHINQDQTSIKYISISVDGICC
jgi:hypothetical protein